jgi:hypothetical protein
MKDINVIKGPTVNDECPVVYQITLSNGAIVTRPDGWGPDDTDRSPQVISHSGKILAPVISERYQPTL